MEVLRVYVLPLILAAGAVLLLTIETQTLQTEREHGHPRWVRFFRRVVGALTIAAISFMLHFGHPLPTQEAGEEVVRSQFNYWMFVLGLVGFAMIFALWDVIDSLRTLKRQIENIERDEVKRLKEQMRQRDRTSE